MQKLRLAVKHMVRNLTYIKAEQPPRKHSIVNTILFPDLLGLLKYSTSLYQHLMSWFLHEDCVLNNCWGMGNRMAGISYSNWSW